MLGFGAEPLGKIEFVVFYKRFADGLAFGLEKCISHAAADKHGVGNFHEVFDDFDFVANFGAAENRNEGARGIGDGIAEIGKLFFHQQTGGGLFDEAGDAHNGGMRTVRGTEGITDENTVAKCSELFGKGFVVFFFFGMKADIFQNENFTIAQGLALAFSAGADAIERKRYGIAQKFLQFFRGRREGILQIRTAFGAAKMRSENEARTLLNREAQGGKRFANAGIVGDHAVLERHVEVHTDEDALAAEVEVVDGELVHKISSQSSVVSFQ